MGSFKLVFWVVLLFTPIETGLVTLAQWQGCNLDDLGSVGAQAGALQVKHHKEILFLLYNSLILLLLSLFISHLLLILAARKFSQ